MIKHMRIENMKKERKREREREKSFPNNIVINNYNYSEAKCNLV